MEERLGLSERGCAQLVKLLQRKGLVEAIHSRRHGLASFVTRAHLVEELRMALQENPRRELADLPVLLGVGSTHTDEAVEALCSQDTSCFIAQSELFHERYFEELVRSIDGELRVEGVVGLGELSARTGVTLELLVQKVSQAVTTMCGTLDEESLTLYTSAHVEAVRGEVLDVMSHAMQPLKLDTFRRGLPVGVFSKLIDEVIVSQDLSGSMLVGTNTWTPSAYVEEKRQRVRTFWADHGFLTKRFCETHGILEREWKGYVKSRIDADAIDLGDQTLVSNHVVDSTLAVVGEILEDDSAGYCDVRDLVPMEMSSLDGDMAAFVGLLASRGDDCPGVVVSDFFLVSAALIDRIKRSASVAAREAAKEAPLPSCSSSSAPVNLGNHEVSAGAKRGKRKEGKRKGRRRDEARDTMSTPNSIEDTISELFLLQCVLRECPELAAEQYEGLASGLAVVVRQTALKAFQKAQSEIAFGVRKSAVEQLSDAYNWLMLYHAGHRIVFSADESADTYDAFLLRTTGQQCLHALYNIAPDSFPTGPPASVGDFLEKLCCAAEKVGVQLGEMDPATEVELSRMHGKILSDKLEEATDAPSALAAAVPLLVLERLGAVVNLPGKALSRTIRLLSPSLEDKEVALLGAAFDQVIQELTSDGEVGANDGSAETLNSLRALCKAKL